MTTIELGGSMVSTKWSFGVLGAKVSDVNTILTVYAGPQMRIESDDDGAGEIMRISTRWPPLLTPSLTRASEISQVE